MRLWLIISALLFSVGFGLLVQNDPGYALFAYGHWTVEMPLWLSFVAILGFLFSTLLLIGLVQSTLSSSQKIRLWWKNHQEHTARTHLHRGLLLFAEGHFEHAERLLTQSASHSEEPLINYVFAAKSAEALGATKRHQDYLELANTCSHGSKLVVELNEAHFQLNHHQWEESTKQLESLQKKSPKHPEVLRLLTKVYQQTQNWRALKSLLPILKKNQVFPDYTHLEQTLYQNLITSATSSSLFDVWKDIPSAQKLNPILIETYVQRLSHYQQYDAAEKQLKIALNKFPTPELVRQFGMLPSQHPKNQLSVVEPLLAKHPGDATLFLSAGRIAKRNQLWGKAREYFEQSLSIEPHPETYAELGQLMEQLAHSEKRNECFKKGLLLATEITEKPNTTLVCADYDTRN